MNDMTFKDVCHWLRSQATNFSRMADDIEATFVGLQNQASHAISSEPVTLERIKTEAGDSAFRLGAMAKRLGTTQKAVKRLVTTDNGFEDRSRGWYAVRSNGTELHA